MHGKLFEKDRTSRGTAIDPARHSIKGVKNRSVFEQLLDIDGKFFLASGFYCLRPEAKIIFTLQEFGKMSVKELISHSGMSYRGFYVVLNRLYEMGLVTNIADSNDKRVRRLSLTRHFNLEPIASKPERRSAIGQR